MGEVRIHSSTGSKQKLLDLPRSVGLRGTGTIHTQALCHEQSTILTGRIWD